MRKLRRSPRMDNPGLFDPIPALPTWQSLPPEIQWQVRQLLAEMLQSCPKNSGATACPTEVADE